MTLWPKSGIIFNVKYPDIQMIKAKLKGKKRLLLLTILIIRRKIADAKMCMDYSSDWRLDEMKLALLASSLFLTK